MPISTGAPSAEATLAAFADQRRIVSGLRHLAPPRDLGVRVRTGIERSRTPWWRRPPAIFAGVGGGLAVVAGALLALVLINGPNEPPVADATQTASPVATDEPQPTDGPVATDAPPSVTPIPTLPPASPPATPGPGETPGPSVPVPTEAPTTASPEPDIYVAVTGDTIENQQMTVVDGSTAETIEEAPQPAGEPIVAELSPDGQWLAYVTALGLSGMNQVSATHIADAPTPTEPEASPLPSSPIGLGQTVDLGAGIAGSPFLERLFWSPDGRYLAYTVADPSEDQAGIDVWLLDTTTDEPARQLTSTGVTYAASFAEDGRLWVSSAGESPVSYLIPLDRVEEGEEITADELESIADDSVGDAFQPLVSPNGAFIIYWAGRMAPAETEWLFSEGGAPQLAEHRIVDDADGVHFASTRPLFSDLIIDQDAFESAAIAWGPDSDAYAVWDTQWTGLSQGGNAAYPDPARIYFGHARDPRGLTFDHAIDATDVPEGTGRVVDVKVSPTGRHLLITAARPFAGDNSPPMADLILVTRNTGDVADEVEFLGRAEEGWFGPAAFDAVDEDED